MIHLVTGGAGFIGSNLVSALLQRGHDVVVFDNMSLGNLRHVKGAMGNGHFSLLPVNCDDLTEFRAAMNIATRGRKGEVEAIWHLAASSDIPAGIADPTIDLKDTFMTTFNALMVMKEYDIPEFHFASSGAIYGDFGDFEIAEDTGPCMPISNYGAMKLASEARISAAMESFGRKASIFRFPNVIGAPATHGVVFDFIKKLQYDNTCLPVLGDGTQQKAYIHVTELISAMLFIAEAGRDKINLYNIGPRDEGVTVRFIAETVRDHVAPNAEIVYGRERRGWVGDIPQFRYSTNRLASLGWEPSMNSEAAVWRAVCEIAQQSYGPSY